MCLFCTLVLIDLRLVWVHPSNPFNLLRWHSPNNSNRPWRSLPSHVINGFSESAFSKNPSRDFRLHRGVTKGKVDLITNTDGKGWIEINIAFLHFWITDSACGLWVMSLKYTVRSCTGRSHGPGRVVGKWITHDGGCRQEWLNGTSDHVKEMLQ